MHSPAEIMTLTIDTGVQKVRKPLLAKMILGFAGGALISLGYLAYIRVIASIAHEWGSFASFIGATIFPIGLIAILLGGGELITSNMTAVSIAWYDKKVTSKELLLNWLTITFANFIGALFVAFFFGHIVGLTSSGIYLEETLAVAQTKIAATPLQAFISGIGCNWFVGLAVWLTLGAKDSLGKIVAIWFPVMTFVAIGFQHSVANMFVIPAAIFENQATWMDFIQNVIPVYLGNVIGGAVMVSAIFYFSMKEH